jgi:hypothetical protein
MAFRNISKADATLYNNHDNPEQRGWQARKGEGFHHDQLSTAYYYWRIPLDEGATIDVQRVFLLGFPLLLRH